MTKCRYPSIRKLRRAAVVLASGTMLQFAGPCGEFWGYTLGTTANSLPSLAYQTALEFGLLPIQLGLAALTGGTGGSGGLGGSGGGGGSGGLAGLGGISNPIGTGGLGGLGI